MHAELLARSLAAIQSETTVDRFQALSRIASRSVALSVLHFLQSNGIGSISKNEITFASTDRLRAATLALQLGSDAEQISKNLSWKDFEQLASHVLVSLGYRSKTNLIFKKPRMEIDVVGINAGFAIVADCKHWKRSNPSSISHYSCKQASRTVRLVEHDRSILQAVPVILTLHSESVRFVNAVPVVPIFQFKAFVMDVKGFLSDICVIEQG